MRNHRWLSSLSRIALTLGLLILLTKEVNADLTVNDIGLYDGTSNAPTAWIYFTGNTGSPVDVYADPQTATNWTSNGSPIALYCIDTIHENAIGDTYSVNPESPPTFATSSSYTDAANRVAWVLDNVVNSADGRGAAQLLIWAIVDKNFSVNWTMTANTGLMTAYNSLSTAMNTDYNQNINYQTDAEFLAAVHGGPNDSLYQDLAFATPEPSTLAIAGLGAMGLIGYGWRHRARRRG